jgi:type VI secretion system secreted protein Hcp
MATSTYIEFEGYEGESAAYDKHIDVVSWTWGMSQTSSAHSGGGVSNAKVSIRDLSFTKHVDVASHNLMKLCCCGKSVGKVILTANKSTELEYVQLQLHDVLITSITHGGIGEDERLIETVTLSFKSFGFFYTPQDPKAAGKAAVNMGWNIAQNCEAPLSKIKKLSPKKS